MTDRKDIVGRLTGSANIAGRTLSDNSMMPPEVSGLPDNLSEELVFLCREAADEITALRAENKGLREATEAAEPILAAAAMGGSWVAGDAIDALVGIRAALKKEGE